MQITINENKYEYEKGTTLLQISQDFKHLCKYPILAGLVNNKLQSLQTRITTDCTLSFVDITHKLGCDVMIRSLSFLLIKACHDTLGDCAVSIKHSLHKGLYCEIDMELSKRDVDAIHTCMKELVHAALPIERKAMGIEKALEHFKDTPSKVKLLKNSDKKRIHIYKCQKYVNHFFGILVPNTSYMSVFDIEKINGKNALMLFGPDMTNPTQPIEFVPSPKLLQVYEERRQLGKVLGISYLYELNDSIANESYHTFIRTMEATHENHIVQIANQIAKENKKIILIAGPSSSGKTSFANRLELQLNVNGLKPITISTDNYFVNRVDTPLDEHGQKNYETIYSIDLAKFNQDMKALLKGEKINLPIYNFISGEREYGENWVQLAGNQPIIIEGIHCLNPLLSAQIEDTLKFKIYVSPLTSLGLDAHNRIKTTDTRLIRRMVRDNRSRGHSATATLKMWDSVRRGEKQYIFPYQEEADVMFNSAFDYELAVLKKYALPILFEVKQQDAEYAEARRLISILQYFKDIEDESDIVDSSLLKEFIGGSIFVD